jgi:diacylglycerol kinase
VKAAVALNLSFQPIEKITLEFHNFATTQASHVNMVPLRASLVKMLLALHMHQVEFVNQAMPFQQIQGSIDRNSINAGIELARMAKDLGSIKVLFRIFDNFENRPALMRHS